LARTKITLTTITIDPKLLKAISEQEAIGWRQFIRGRMSITWRELIKDRLTHNDIANITAEKWGNQIAFINWKHILRLWHLRNKEVHGEQKKDRI
jgi:hypothetical protein